MTHSGLFLPLIIAWTTQPILFSPRFVLPWEPQHLVTVHSPILVLLPQLKSKFLEKNHYTYFTFQHVPCSQIGARVFGELIGDEELGTTVSYPIVFAKNHLMVSSNV